MIIKELRLTNFGKFNHKDISLSRGLNIVYGENEAGKTTIHTFIRAMLFGLERKRGRSGEKDTYSRYEPWDNPDNYNGSMRIEKNNVAYRIERNFNKNNKIFKVINEDEGRELKQPEIDELFTGLDEGCYYNTISISQLGSATDSQLEAILKNYATNLAETKTMEIDINAAYDQLDMKKKEIEKESGIKDEHGIERELRQYRETLDISEEEQKKIVSSIRKSKEELSNLEKRSEEIESLAAKNLENMAKYRERKDKLYQEVQELNREISKYEKTLSDIEEHKKTLTDKLKEKGISDKEDMQKLADKTLNRSNTPALFIILLMAFIGVTLGYGLGNYEMLFVGKYLTVFAGLVCCSVFCLLMCLVEYALKKRKKKRLIEEVQDLRKIAESIDMSDNEETYTRRQYESRKEELSHTENLIKIEAEKQVDDEDFGSELKELEQDILKTREVVSRLSWTLEDKREKDLSVEKRMEDLSERLKKIEAAKEEIEAIEDARKSIEEIAAEIRAGFGRELNKKASEYMSKITDGKYKDLVIDEELNISVNGIHKLIPFYKLSKGTNEQIYMSLRLAAADIIFGDDKKPMLLDDALVMYDNKRLSSTLSYMANEMEQTILFSCHTREKVIADKLGLKYNLIKL